MNRPYRLKHGAYDPLTSEWLRFRHIRGGLGAFLPNGKIVFPSRDSEFNPVSPGYYLAASVTNIGRFAVAHLVRAHRTLTFTADDAFGDTQPGVSFLFSYRKRQRKRLEFACDPSDERLEIFGYDTFQTLSRGGTWRYFKYRHRAWRLRNQRGERKLGNEEFEDAEKRVRLFLDTTTDPYLSLGDPSPNSRWSAALDADVITREEYEEAARRIGPLMWTYSGS